MQRADFYQNVATDLRDYNVKPEQIKQTAKALTITQPGGVVNSVTVSFSRNHVQVETRFNGTVVYRNDTNWNEHFKPNMVILTVQEILDQMQFIY